MSKRLSLSAAVAVATLMALPAASQATDCLNLKHARSSTVAVVDGTGHALRRVGEVSFALAIERSAGSSASIGTGSDQVPDIRAPRCGDQLIS